jgi:MoaA/NifB/PqqE/SkfB family radical SAM enzyme
MFDINKITHLHIEASTLCNARCPQCPRNVCGYNHNLGYEETSLSLDTVQKSLSLDFLNQIQHVLFNGNFGDFTANLEILDIIRYLRSGTPNMRIEVSTNGSARSEQFWKDLGALGNIEVSFCLDGLEDTHHLYRQDTNWQRIINNAQTFMAVGGSATWKMIPFDHNKHQITECEQLAAQLGFSRFWITDHGRNTGPVFDKDGMLSHVLGQYQGFSRADEMIAYLESNPGIRLPNQTDHIDCQVLKSNSIYISADAKVYPCCWIGFSPLTYHAGWLGMLNKQIAPLVKDNNLKENTLEQCLEWMGSIKSSWGKRTHAEGRLMQCDINCGHCGKSSDKYLGD